MTFMVFEDNKEESSQEEGSSEEDSSNEEESSDESSSSDNEVKTLKGKLKSIKNDTCSSMIAFTLCSTTRSSSIADKEAADEEAGDKIRYAFELLTNALWKRDYDLFGIDEHSESFLVGEFQVLVTSMIQLPIINSSSLGMFIVLLMQKCQHVHMRFILEAFAVLMQFISAWKRRVVAIREKIMTIPRKEKKRKARREENVEKAAVLDMVFRRCIGCLEDAQVEKI
ncbi:hypothetical protein ZIOFF_032072 [Zingiber officinale]|uniref:Uncharacterized protein n=1 Tax=Zingiber officinale TaxID=94328 RepID=A0A8J5GV06_ZINOF|nr:hypothetical protein ZIOFF_032072 [Zingiber officinale]